MAMFPDSRAGFLPTAMTDLYVAPVGGALVEFVTAGNDTAIDVFAHFNVTLAAPTAGTEETHNLKITPDDKKVSVVPGRMFFKEGDKISGFGSGADAVTYFISAVGGYFATGA